MKDKTVIVFSPHPDDETLGCGGTIAKKVNEGCKVVVVVMTDGRHALRAFHIYSNPTPEELAEIRRAEMKRAMEDLMIKEENLIFLGLEDGTLCQRSDEVEKQAARILKDHLASEVYCTSEKDVHSDHKAASSIVRNSIKKANICTDHYEYLIWQRFDRFGRLNLLPTNHPRRGTVSVDISAFLHLKEMAVKEFQSQVSIISKRQKRPVIKNLKQFLRNKETFYVVDKRKERTYGVHNVRV